MATDNFDVKRLAWHSRRGMLELDLILVPFAEKKLPYLDTAQRELYRILLSQEDQDMFSWFTRRESPPTESLREIVELVLESHHGIQG